MCTGGACVTQSFQLACGGCTGCNLCVSPGPSSQ
jgi:hypothetical protein